MKHGEDFLFPDMSDWTVDFDDEALDDLKRLSPAVREQVFSKLEWLRENFFAITPLPLGGEWRGFYKLRVGDYRAIYDIRWSSTRLIVVVVDHRSRVYRRKRR